MEHKNKLVSIIIPVYNAHDYLPRNIESILSQRYQNLELILVDDGSKDDSASIMRYYGERDARIKNLFQENSGAPTARNYGFSIAKGEYIQFVDSDDCMAEEALSRMVTKMEKTGADIVMGAYDTVDEEDTFIKKVELPLTANVYTKKDTQEVFSLIPPMPGNKLYRGSIVRKYDLEFAPFLKQAQDLNFYLKFLLFADKIAVLDEVVYHYRVRSGSISHTYSLVILETIKSVEDAENFYNKHGVVDEKLFTNIKFFHYTFQLQKVPQIEKRADRRTALKAFQLEFAKLNRKKLLEKFQGKPFFSNHAKLMFGNLFISSFYRNYQRHKAKTNKIS